MTNWTAEQMAGLGLIYRVATLVHEPLGKPGGPGLWGMKGVQLPAYIQHIRNDLMTERGMSEGRATATAIEVCRKWAKGGGDVHPDTRAKAIAALAEFDRLRLRARATRSGEVMGDTGTYDADGLDASWDGSHDDLPDLTGLGVAEFDAAAGDEGGGEPSASRAAPKLGTGARFARLKASLGNKGASDPGALAAWIGRRKFGKARFHKLASAARKAAPSAAARAVEAFRTYPLEVCEIVRLADGDGTGRVVEAYAAVWDTPAEIHDHQGHYMEEIDPHAFDGAIERARPERHGGRWNVAVLYNHGLTVHGSPAERFSMPVGIPLEIRAEGRGLLTRTQYAATPLGEEILELVNMGALTAQSFTGAIQRSDPMLQGPGAKYRARGGALQTVRRLSLGLREYGLTPFPAYSGAEVCGVRMQLPGWDEDIPAGSAQDEDADPADGEGTGLPPEAGDSPGSTGHRIYQLRSQELLEAAGITLPRKG